ncbi:MAG: hypothetical protein HKN15_01280 [Xanthomonadales bacterium]|nr:hypothetical protein [Xanthomonadales bacterium]
MRAEAGKEKYDYITGNVLSVLDGDSIRFQASHGDLTIELRGIDAPELGQKFGKHARHYLSELINSKKVTIAMKADDRDGILRGEIFLDGVSINKLLLKDGFAWARRGSSGNRSWISIEKQARDHRFGLWRQHDAMAPWEYRELVLEGVGATP